MKLEVGMYCYDKTNRKLGIGKIIEFQRNNNAVIEYKSGVVLISIGNIMARHNPIDLIELGDYVNGNLVTGFDYQCTSNKRVVFSNVKLDGIGIKIPARDIKSIVTKEQFNSMKYVVGEQE